MTSSSYWVNVKLPEVVYFQEGPGLRKFQYTDSGIPFLNIRTLQNERINKSLCQFLDSNKVSQKYQHFLLQKGDIICSTSGTIGKTAIIHASDLPLMLNTSVIRFRTLDDKIVLQKYIYYFLKSEIFLVQALNSSTGSAQVNVGPSHLKLFDFPLAPINEQKRIADKLDQTLAIVERAKARLARVPQILKQFRQSVLAAATDGRLTEDWRTENGLIFDEWTRVKVSDVANRRLGKMLDKSKNIGLPRRYLRNINVRWFYFKLDDIQEIRVTEEECRELEICNGDVMMCEGGEPGRCAVWRNGPTDLVYQKALHRIRFYPEVLADWFCYCVKSDADFQKLDNYFTGTTIKHFTGQALSSYLFLLPKIDEQHEIIRRVETLFALSDRIEARYKAITQQVDKLTQSLLAKAFRGELVPQNPNDEPASVLLERIRAERVAVKPSKASRRR